jgi:hypothetical protein
MPQKSSFVFLLYCHNPVPHYRLRLLRPMDRRISIVWARCTAGQAGAKYRFEETAIANDH